MDKIEILLKLYKEDKITTEEFKLLSESDKEYINICNCNRLIDYPSNPIPYIPNQPYYTVNC